jgi:hypothetical protein
MNEVDKFTTMTAEEAIAFVRECQRGDVYDQAKRLLQLICNEKNHALDQVFARLSAGWPS